MQVAQFVALGRQDSQSGGRSNALAISTLFTTFVLMPLPRPSICASNPVSTHGMGQ